MTDPAQQITQAIKEIEQNWPDAAWSFSKIINERHAINPFGAGYSVQINGVNLLNEPISVFEKSKDSIADATKRALQRFEQRYNGEAGA